MSHRIEHRWTIAFLSKTSQLHLDAIAQRIFRGRAGLDPVVAVGLSRAAGSVELSRTTLYLGGLLPVRNGSPEPLPFAAIWFSWRGFPRHKISLWDPISAGHLAYHNHCR